MTDDQFLNPVGGRHLDQFLDGDAVVKTAVAADDKGFSRRVDGVENALQEVFEVVFLHYDFGFFPQTRGAHFLVRVRGGCNHLYHNLSLKIRVDMIVDNLTPFGANSRESSVLLTAILSRCGSGADEFGQAFDFLLGSDVGNA